MVDGVGRKLIAVPLTASLGFHHRHHLHLSCQPSRSDESFGSTKFSHKKIFLENISQFIEL